MTARLTYLGLSALVGTTGGFLYVLITHGAGILAVTMILGAFLTAVGLWSMAAEIEESA